MALDVNTLRRRPPGPRWLIALDQSTLSDLATNADYRRTRDLLRNGVEAGKLVCPVSLGTTDETLAARDSWQDISDLHEELSMGIELLDPKEIRQRETTIAAAAFTGHPTPYPIAEEAFECDPHTDRTKLFPGGVRVTARLGPTNFQRMEVAREKEKEASLRPAYDQARMLRRSFDAQAAAEYEAMVGWVLGPLADPNFEIEFARKQTAAIRGLEAGDYGPISKLQAVAQRRMFAEYLVERFPVLVDCGEEFARSDELANMPALRYPALLRAGLAVMRGRLAHRGDGYDIDHLTSGLSRCDFVTADGGMTQLVRNYKLVPTDCQLFSARERQQFHRAIEVALATAPSSA